MTKKRLLQNTSEIIQTENYNFLVHKNKHKSLKLFRLEVIASMVVLKEIDFEGSFLPILSFNCIEEEANHVFLSVTQGNKIIQFTSIFSKSYSLKNDSLADTSTEVFEKKRSFVFENSSGILDFQKIDFGKNVYIANVIEDGYLLDIYLILFEIQVKLFESKKHYKLLKQVQEIKNIFDQHKPELKIKLNSTSPDFKLPSNLSIKSIQRLLAKRIQITTMISFDGGINWEYLQHQGNRVNLNLLSKEIQAPFFTDKEAKGVLMGVGNLGRVLGPESEWSSFISSDFGKHWSKLNKQKLLFNVENKGGLILGLRDSEPTSEIMFSWDYGETFKEMMISQSGRFW